MGIKDSYNKWSLQYDTNVNKTRDLEGQSLRNMLQNHINMDVLEIGCGTGKNTEWFVKNFETVTAVDFSEEMLDVAKTKIKALNVEFILADITLPWRFVENKIDIISFSLVLEHIEDLNHIFNEANIALKPGGYIYIGELHPFKQYSGSKARFDTDEGEETVTCFTHHISEFINTAKSCNLNLVQLEEHFDDDDKTGLPRILTLLFQKK